MFERAVAVTQRSNNNNFVKTQKAISCEDGDAKTSCLKNFKDMKSMLTVYKHCLFGYSNL